MGEIVLPQPTMVVVGLLASQAEFLTAARLRLEQDLGPVRFTSETIAFDFTRYYNAEMGIGLRRQWLGLADLVEQNRLPEIKILTNGIEREFKKPGKGRAVNIDPGLLSTHNLVLASTKDHAHRVYVGQPSLGTAGIRAEVTMIYQSGGYRPLEWTYRDYRTDECVRFLEECREYLVATGRAGSDRTSNTQKGPSWSS